MGNEESEVMKIKDIIVKPWWAEDIDEDVWIIGIDGRGRHGWFELKEFEVDRGVIHSPFTNDPNLRIHFFSKIREWKGRKTTAPIQLNGRKSELVQLLEAVLKELEKWWG